MFLFLSHSLLDGFSTEVMEAARVVAVVLSTPKSLAQQQMRASANNAGC